MITLLTFSGIQSMNGQRKMSFEEIEANKMRLDMRKAENYGTIFQDVHDHLKATVDERKTNKDNFNAVLENLLAYGLPYYDYDNAFEDLEAKRDHALRMLVEEIKIKENPFIAVLAELKKQEDSEEQVPELTEGLEAFFSREFAIVQEEREQEAAFSKLSQSLIGAESVQNMPDAQQVSDEIEKAIEPVTASYFTPLWDYWYGSSNLVSELSDNKMSLDVLKKSPDMQTRINNMIASYSPSKKRNPAMLSSLVEIYNSVDTLKFKFINADVNSDVHNACEKWRREEEVKFASLRTARVLAMMQLLKKEMQKLQQEEKPLVETISKLEQIKKLSMQTGMVVNDTEQVEVDQKNIVLSARTFDVYCHLETLCDELLNEESAK